MESLTFLGFSEDKPKTVLTPAVMSSLPLGINDGPLANLNNAITWQKASSARRVNEFDVCPLIAMMVNIIADLAEEQPLGLKDPVRFFQEWWKRMRKRIVVLFRRPDNKSESPIKILSFVLSLVWNMGRIVNDYVKAAGFEW